MNGLVNFLIVAFALFLMLRSVNRLKTKEAEAPPTPPAPSAQAVLLTEIRDLLARR